MERDVKDNGSESESEHVKAKKHSSSKSKKSKSKKEPREALPKEPQEATYSPKHETENRAKRDTVKSDSGVVLWDLALQQAQEKQNAEDTHIEEKSIVFLGSKDAGKTSIIFRILDREDVPKPTTALEYTYARRPRNNSLEKDIAHIWELGGGTWLSKLADITVDADSIRTMSVALVLDLSKPNELWVTLDKWLQVLKARVEVVLNDLRDTDVKVKEHLKRDAWQRVGEDHPDQELIDPFLLPLVIIGTKYDIFQDFDPEKRKIICKTLRFVAHRHGAHLMFFSTKLESLLGKTRLVVNNFMFSTPLAKSAQTEYSKPLMITAGQDAFQQIGTPPLPEGDIGRITAKTPWDLWKHAYVQNFPQESFADPSLAPDPAKDKQFAEKEIDAMRAKKDEELEYYRKQAERRGKASYMKSPLEGYS